MTKDKTTPITKSKVKKQSPPVTAKDKTKKIKKSSVKKNDTVTAKETKTKKVKKTIIKKDDSTAAEETKTTDTKIKKTIKTRSKAYKTAKAKTDINQSYPLKKAIDLVKKTSLSKFDGKVEAHVNTLLKPGKVGNITFPHLKTKAKKVVIATEAIVKKIQDGKIDFDVLIATPAFMPKLLPLARFLGPKGLMPNPKNGTLTDKPKQAVDKFSAAATVVKTEKKAPVIHLVIGQVSQPVKEIQANVEELVKLIDPLKIKKLILKATMGPAIKVKV